MDNNNSSLEEVKDKALEIFTSNDAIMLATTGGEYSPWVLGAYYASDGMFIYLLLERDGKSLANIKINNKVAFSISRNDAMQDFLQGYGTAEILQEEEEENVRAKLLAKMPWYKTFVPMIPIRIEISKLYVTSLQNGWFPAKLFFVN